MSTLVEVIDKLKEQDTSLTEIKTNTSESSKGIGNIAASTKDTNKGIQRLVEYFTGGDALERDRDAERKRKKEAQEGITRPEGRSGGSGVGSNTAGGSRAQDLMNMAALGGAGFQLGNVAAGILKRTIPGFLITAFADEIGDYVASQTGSEELGATTERAVAAAGIGSILFGKKGLLIGAVLGTLANEQVRSAAGELGDEVVKRTTEMLRELDIKVPDIKNVEDAIVVLQQNVAQGITGFTKLVKGEMTYDDLKEDWQEMAGILALPLLLTGGGRGLVLKTLTTGFLALSGWGKFLEYMGSKVPPKIPTAVPSGTPAVNPFGSGTNTTPETPKRNFTVKDGKFFGRDGKELKGGALETAKKTYADDLARQKAKPIPKTQPTEIPKTNNPRLNKFFNAMKGQGLLAGALALYELNSIAESDLPEDQKVLMMAQVLQGAGGSVLGAAIGSFFGPIGTALGGIVGYAAGGSLDFDTTKQMARWFLGKKLEPVDTRTYDFTNSEMDLDTTGQQYGVAARTARIEERPKIDRRGRVIAEEAAPVVNRRDNQTGSSGTVIAPDNSTSVSNTNVTAMAGSQSLRVTDALDTPTAGMQSVRGGYGFGR